MHDVFQSKFAYDIYKTKYSLDGTESWYATCRRVVDSVCKDKIDSDTCNQILHYMVARKFIPGGRYLANAGRPYAQVKNCFALRVEDTRESWCDLMFKASSALMSQGGIGVDYSLLREKDAPIKRAGGKSSGPIELIKIIDAIGEGVKRGGGGRSAIYASLYWWHKDIEEFIRLKEKDGTLANTNISVGFDSRFLELYNAKDPLCTHIWDLVCEHAFKYADPGFSFNMNNPNECLRNACAEFISENDSDSCNLGTPFISRISSKDEFRKILRCNTALLLCGQGYSLAPYQKVTDVATENNKIGMGLGGVADWLMQRKSQYEVTPELREWLEVYREETTEAAIYWNKILGRNPSKATRSIAPAGSIGILAESSTGIEPLFCKAYRRRYMKDNEWKMQYVVDGTVKRLFDMGISEEYIWDAADLSFEQRVKFQADIQDFVDMGISSTVNLPRWGSEENNSFNLQEKKDIIIKYAPRLRGLTVYSDASKGGQPLTRVSLSTALSKEGVEFIDKETSCINGVCGL